MNFKHMMARYMEQADAGAAAGGAGADQGAAAAADTGAASAASLLAGGAAAPAGESGSFDYIPEKLRANKEDGSFDLEASSRKVAEAYSALEKRFGAGEAPPKAAGDYVVTVPDTLKEAFDPATDVGMQGFLTGALEAGLNQKQVDYVMGKYFEMAPQLVAGAVQYDATTGKAELEKVWTPAEFQGNVNNAYSAASAAASKAGIDINDIMGGPLANDPTFMRLMAALGPEFAEDRGPGTAAPVSGESVSTLLASDAYKNPAHADHAKVSQQVRTYYERKYGNQPAG